MSGPLTKSASLLRPSKQLFRGIQSLTGAEATAGVDRTAFVGHQLAAQETSQGKEVGFVWKNGVGYQYQGSGDVKESKEKSEQVTGEFITGLGWNWQQNVFQ